MILRASRHIFWEGDALSGIIPSGFRPPFMNSGRGEGSENIPVSRTQCLTGILAAGNRIGSMSDVSGNSVNNIARLDPVTYLSAVAGGFSRCKWSIE